MSYNEMDLSALPTNQESYWDAWGNSEPPMVDDFTAYSAMMNGAYEDFGMGYGPMYDMMESASCSANAAPAAFTAGEANGTAPASMPNQVSHKCPPLLEGGDKDKSVCLYNYVITNFKFVKDDQGQYYACLRDDPYHKAWAIKGDQFEVLLNNTCITQLKTILSSSMVKTVKDNLCSVIMEYATPATVGLRSVHSNGTLYYKLNDKTFLQVANGSCYTGISPDAEVYFTSRNSFVNQVIPDTSSPATALPELVKAAFNVHSEDLLRFLAHLCCFFLPHINVPMLILSGGHGTAKTTVAKKIVSLVDPGTVDVVSMPKDEAGLTALLSASTIIGLDNVGKISRAFSDKLCIACTGGYDPQRELYTNANLVSVPLKCHIVMNGIGNIVTRPDLAERSNVIYHSRISRRLTDTQVWQEFNDMKPRLLGSIFNTLRIGLPMVGDVLKGYNDLPRMAEFAQYGAAFIQAMGLDPIRFVEEYKRSCSAFVGDCAEMDDFYSLVKSFLIDRNSQYQDTATNLLKALNHYATCNHKPIDKMTPSTLSRALNDGKDDLHGMGIEIDIKSTTPKSISLQLLATDDQQMGTGAADA